MRMAGRSDEDIIEHGRMLGEKRGETPERNFSRGKDAPPPAAKPEIETEEGEPREPGTYKDAILRKETAIANLRELELAEKRGELVNKQEAETAWMDAAVRLRDGILSVPDRIALQLEGRTAREIREMMMSELRKALELASSQIEKAA
jgi:phage terminase Nu1 subunit (DNA packaging protein)